MKKQAKRSVGEEVKAIEARLARSSKAKPKRFTSWSFSRYSEYKQCPKKAALHHLHKIEEPASEPMRRGSDIGRLAELYIKGELKKLPAELARFKAKFAELRAQRKRYPRTVEVEESWAFTKEMKVTTWNDWDNCVLRVKVDVGQHESKTKMRVIDWKTGKFHEGQNEAYLEQLELYAFGAFHRHPSLEEVETMLCYLDAGVTYPDDFGGTMTFTRADVPRLRKMWDKRTRAMLLDKAFPARPNEKCQWCFYRKENSAALPGGKQLCQY